MNGNSIGGGHLSHVSPQSSLRVEYDGPSAGEACSGEHAATVNPSDSECLSLWNTHCRRTQMKGGWQNGFFGKSTGSGD